MTEDIAENGNSYREMSLDEIAKICHEAALEAGYPNQLAEFAGEMTVWLERHRMPGCGALAIAIEGLGRYDAAKAQPKTLESGEAEFPEPITGGLAVLQNFDKLTFPARISGPVYGILLMVPFFALAAHQKQAGLQVSFLDEDDNAVARLSYEDGHSALEGDGRAVLVCRKLGIEFPAKPDCMMASPQDGPVKVPSKVAVQLALKH